MILQHLGNLDVTGFGMVHSGEVVLSFASGGETGINNVELVNAETGSSPIIRAVGADTNVDLQLQAQGTGRLDFAGLQWPTGDGTSGQVVTTDGSGNLSFTSVPRDKLRVVALVVMPCL